ncbi:MAG: hypothetical protein R6W68_08465 [Ignavibacteriaceae bacterium]
MHSFVSKIFYLLSAAGFIYAFYNAALAVNSLFQKSGEASGPIFDEAKQMIYIAAGCFLVAFILLMIGRKFSKHS